MECPRCHYANTDGARFCGECGASLTRDVTCSSCGHANPAGQTFCNGCGGRLDESARSAARDRRAYTPKHLVEKILASRTALEGERKQVTVLFADVKGSMDLAEQIDPEMFHQVMERVAALLANGVRDPLPGWELDGRGPLRRKLGASRARGFTRFVGRDDEAAALEAALGRAIAGQGQVVGVVADAGVGKSRLCFEFAQRCRARGLAVYEAHAVAHGKAIPFLTLLEYLRGYFGISEQHPRLAPRDNVA